MATGTRKETGEHYEPAWVSGTRDNLSALVRQIDNAKPPRRTDLIKELARALIDIRQRFLLPDGSPDLAGRSYAYRALVNDIYRESDIPRDRSQSIQALVRYHVGNLIREDLAPGELEEYGLLPETPLERSKELRNERRHMLQSVRGQDEDIDPVTVAATIAQLLNRIRPATLENLDGDDRAEFIDRMTEVFVQVVRVRSLLTDPNGPDWDYGHMPNFMVVLEPKPGAGEGNWVYQPKKKSADIHWSDDLTKTE